MDKKEEQKTDNLMENTTFSNQMNIPAGFSTPCEADEKEDLGFIDMLNLQEYTIPSMFDFLLTTPLIPSPASTYPESSEVVNAPATPNSSSISSSSTEAVPNDNQWTETVEKEEQNQEKINKQLEPKKKNQKRQRKARFAFITKSEVDHLDDGYKWRKYGQKPVKNSPFPRNYYRCTSKACVVKKRFERSSDDPSIVVTTYEGTHTHPCPIMHRGILPETTTTTLFEGGGGASSFIIPRVLHYPQQPYFHNYLTSFSNTNNSSFPPLLQETPFWPSASSLARDHGLLQDMLPFPMIKEPKEE
ncbi:putative WRKY transcription factor 23 [Forsythia ovata]|uniref:WRKY transcription factor 23 n=1 Tax=Forsythia ovata TaxID=205694 RepID=A0ABD1V0C3_9LAMI